MNNRPIIKNYRSGRVGYDGNSMVGGEWWGCEHLAYKTIEPWDYLAFLEEDRKYDDVADWFGSEVGEVTIEAYLSIGEDTSTNSSSCDIDEVFYPDEFDQAVDRCSLLTDAEKTKLKGLMSDMSDEKDGYELYED